MTEKLTIDNCQACLRPKAEPDAPTVTQWISVCRCDKTYSPNAQYSIDLCITCYKRVVPNATMKVSHPDLCFCEGSQRPQSIPNYIAQNQTDTVELRSAPASFPIERYKPLGILGQGSKTSVVLARDKQTGKKVAVKCFRRATPEILKSFEQEARKLSKLSHTNIARIVGFGIHDNVTPYLVTEYKDGFNLEQYLALHGTPSHDVAVKILISVCEALIYAQKESLLHGDLRASNILFIDDLNSEPSVSIIDFSVPRLKMADRLESKDAYYMSADEARGVEYNEKSEVYTLGCIGFALLTGQPPFQEGSARDIQNLHALKLPPKISDLKFDNTRPGDLVEVIERCLEKDPSYRFETVAKLLERLEVFPRREKLQIANLLAAKKKKKIIMISAAGLGVVILLSAIGYFVFASH